MYGGPRKGTKEGDGVRRSGQGGVSHLMLVALTFLFRSLEREEERWGCRLLFQEGKKQKIQLSFFDSKILPAS